MILDVSAPQHLPASTAANKLNPQMVAGANMAVQQRLNSNQINNNMRQQPTHLLNNNTTWPISPIYPAANVNNNHLIFNGVGRMDCESPTVVSLKSIDSKGYKAVRKFRN